MKNPKLPRCALCRQVCLTWAEVDPTSDTRLMLADFVRNKVSIFATINGNRICVVCADALRKLLAKAGQ